LCLLALACSAPHPARVADPVGGDGSIPWRVVALAPDVTEIAFAVGAGSQIVATAAATDHPAEALPLPRLDPDDVEAILAHSPDLVLATTAGNDPRVVDRLRGVGLAVCTVDVTTLAGLSEAVELIGRVTGHELAGRELAGAVAARISRASGLTAGAQRRRALFVIWWEPLIVAAPGTFHDDMLALAALDNLAPAGAGRYPRVDPELLLDPRLEVVVSPDEADARALHRRIVDTAVGARLRSGAVRVLWVPADLANRPGPRLIDGLEALIGLRASLT